MLGWIGRWQRVVDYSGIVFFVYLLFDTTGHDSILYLTQLTADNGQIIRDRSMVFATPSISCLRECLSGRWCCKDCQTSGLVVKTGAAHSRVEHHASAIPLFRNIGFCIAIMADTTGDVMPISVDWVAAEQSCRAPLHGEGMRLCRLTTQSHA